MDSGSMEVNRRKKRAKTDRLDVVGLVDLLARHLMGSHKPPFSIVSVPAIEDEDLRHLGRELKLVKKDRTRISNRIKGLLANNGLVLSSRKDLTGQIERFRLWDGERLPPFLKARLLRYAEDYGTQTERIKVLERERTGLLRSENGGKSVEKVWRLRAWESRRLGVTGWSSSVGGSSRTASRWVRWRGSRPHPMTAASKNGNGASGRPEAGGSEASRSSRPGLGCDSSQTANCRSGTKRALVAEANGSGRSGS